MSDFTLFISTFFSLIWKFFTSWYLPGTNVTPAAFLLFILFGGIVVGMLKYFIKGVDGSGGSHK